MSWFLVQRRMTTMIESCEVRLYHFASPSWSVYLCRSDAAIGVHCSAQKVSEASH